MDRGQLSSRIAALREGCAVVAREVAAEGRGLGPVEAFELAGEAQAVANCADGLVAVLGAWGARVETTMHESGPWERVHPVGYVDAMAAAEMSLATGVTEGLAGRKAALGAALGERFPATRDLVLAGDLPVSSAHKVVEACAGLDVDACLRVDAELAPRLAAMDPARVTSSARAVAARVAADQVAAHAAKTRRCRTVEVRPGVDGLTEWFASLPTATSAAAWSAVESLAGEYRAVDPDLSVPESRADAFGDLLLRNVHVTAKVTLGVPVVTGVPVPEDQSETTRVRYDRGDDDTVIDHDTGELVRLGDLTPASREELSWVEMSPETAGDLATVVHPVSDGCAVSGTRLAGLGWVEPHTVAGLLKTLPLDVARAVLDAHTGTLASHTSPALPATQSDARARHHPRRHLPHVGLHPTRRPHRPRPHPTLARRPHHPRQPRRPLPTPPPDETAPAAGATR